jgi:ABC-2 type transport system permease protein
MPIHDQSYRRYGGSKEQAGQAWLVIAGTGIRTILRKRLFLGLLICAWVPFIVFAFGVYLSANFPQLAQYAPLSLTPERLRDSMHGFWAHDIWFFSITVWVGAGLIANDRRANALQLYLAKPLTRGEYIAGKFAILATFLLLITWLPAVLLLVLQIVFSGSFAFIRQNLYIIPAVTVDAFVQVVVATFTMLALSSLSKSGRYVAILYAGAYWFSAAVFGVIYGITGSSKMAWLSIPANLDQLGYLIFRLRPPYTTPPVVSLLVVGALIGICVWVLERRVRGVEVVS